jgi:hypothetical protein
MTDDGGKCREEPKGEIMPETTINVVDALRGQQDQLRRLIAQKIWISDAPRATLSEIVAHVIGKGVHVMRIATGQIGRRPQDYLSAADFGASNSV